MIVKSQNVTRRIPLQIILHRINFNKQSWLTIVLIKKKKQQTIKIVFCNKYQLLFLYIQIGIGKSSILRKKSVKCMFNLETRTSRSSIPSSAIAICKSLNETHILVQKMISIPFIYTYVEETAIMSLYRSFPEKSIRHLISIYAILSKATYLVTGRFFLKKWVGWALMLNKVGFYLKKSKKV